MIRAFRRILRDGPHPLREFFLLWLIAFCAAGLLTMLHIRAPLRPATGVLGASAVLLGSTLAANIAGAADFWAQIMSNHRGPRDGEPRSALTQTSSVRLFFLVFAAIGVYFIIGSIVDPG